MEENVWPDAAVSTLIKEKYIIVSLYVDERKSIACWPTMVMFKTKNGVDKKIVTVGDKWATFQSENFDAVSQPQYAIIHPSEKILTKTKAYTPLQKNFLNG